MTKRQARDFLASEAASGVSGQCIGIGGDKLSLWSHPQEIRSAFHQGGWTADDIASAWGITVRRDPSAGASRHSSSVLPSTMRGST